MTNTRDYRVPTIDDDPDVPLWNGYLAQDVATDVDTIEANLEGVAARTPTYESDPDALVLILDALRRQTWLGARKLDGGPTSHSVRLLATRLGITAEGQKSQYLAALTDANGLLTDLAIRAKDGQVDDFVMKRWATRLAPLLNLGNVQLPSTPDDPASGVTSAMLPLFQSLAAAGARHHAGTALPANPTDFTANGEAARLTFPSRYSDATPVPLVIQFEGMSDRSIEPRWAYKLAVQEAGALYGKCNFHGDSYGSPSAMADARALYEYALRLAPISGVILSGNSMGGIAALNALHTGTIPNVLGVYLTDPTYDLRQRYDNGRAPEIKAAYGLAADGSDYATKTAGYDPALAPVADFRGVPIKMIASSGDTSVPLALHGQKLKERLAGANKVELIDTGTAGHNTDDRFSATEFVKFITAACGGSTGLRA